MILVTLICDRCDGRGGSRKNGHSAIGVMRLFAKDKGWTSPGQGRDYCPECSREIERALEAKPHRAEVIQS